jgi:hypothetical protein
MKITFDDDELDLPLRNRLQYLQYLLKKYPINVLEGESVRDALTCPECTNVFLVTSGKKRIYCSQACAFRYLSWQRRERLKADPAEYEKFLRKQRKRARKAYTKRKAEKRILML